MKYLKIFETNDEYTNYYTDGVPSGVLVYIKETNKAVFSTNNIDGETKQYDMASSEVVDDLNEQIESLEAEMNTLNQNVENLQSQIEDLILEKDGLNSEIVSLIDQLTDKENEISSLNDRISELEANQETHEITFDESTNTLSVNDI